MGGKAKKQKRAGKRKGAPCKARETVSSQPHQMFMQNQADIDLLDASAKKLSLDSKTFIP